MNQRLSTTQVVFVVLVLLACVVAVGVLTEVWGQ